MLRPANRAATSRADEVQAILEHCRTRSHLSTAGTGRQLTARAIGAVYDQFVARTPDRDLPQRFMNFGCWNQSTGNAHDAAVNLIETLIARFPDRKGHVLDVACGVGATIGHLSRYWAAEKLHGINISPLQVRKCQQHQPHSYFEVMDAAHLTFDDATFQNVLCIEAAFHFDTRERFLRHAHRVLTPGGVLALTDLLLDDAGYALLPMWLECNHLASLSDYEALLKTTGFSQVEVRDITDVGWRPAARHKFDALHREWLNGAISFSTLQDALVELYRLGGAIRYSVLCFAVK